MAGNPEWANYVGEQRCTPARVAAPRDVLDVVREVKQAAADGLRVRVAGGGHSSSGLVPTNGLLLDIAAFDTLHVLSGDPQNGPLLVRAGAGIQIAALDRALWDHGLALDNHGSASVQTLAGALATGTHGSGARHGALADYVRAVELVDGQGTHRRITPSDLQANGPRPEVPISEADDSTFYAAVVGLGLTGVLISVDLEVVAAFDLEETRTLTTWEALRDDPDLDTTIRESDHWELWVNPYASSRGHRTLMTTRQRKPAGGTPHARASTAPLRWRIVRWIITHFTDAFPGSVRGLLDLSLKSQRTFGAPARDRSYRIFDLGDINRMPAVATEWFFPITHWKAAVSAMLDEAARLRIVPRAAGGSPFGVRFVPAGKHFLAMNHGAPDALFCAVESPVYATEHDRETVLSAYERVADAHGGRPHWGQEHSAKSSDARRRYPKFGDFLTARALFDPDERFANFRTSALGLTSTRFLPPVAGDIDYYDATRRRTVLDPSKPVGIKQTLDVRRFEVGCDAATFAVALADVLAQPGRHIGGDFEILRARGVTGPFTLGEQFQGRFAIDDRLGQDGQAHPSTCARLFRWLRLEGLAEGAENLLLSNYGKIVRLELSPPRGMPHRLSYAYTEGTPFSGRSDFSVIDLGPGRCEFMQRIALREQTRLARLFMRWFGLEVHNRVVTGQAFAPAQMLGVACRRLDTHPPGTPGGDLAHAQALLGPPP